MAENITTLLDMTDAENISGDDYLYLVQGSGSKRDRKLKLSALFASDPSHTLVVDSEDYIPGEFLLGKFDQYSHDVHQDTGGKVRFYADTSRAGRIIRGEPKNLDGSEFNTERVQFMAAVIDFGRQDSADCVQNFYGTSKFFKAEVDQELKVRNGGVNAGGGLSVPKPNSVDNLAKIDGRTGDIQTVGKVKGFGAEFSAIDITGRAKAVTFEGKVETNDISAKDSSKPINVSAISGFNITGKSSVSGDFSSGSLMTGKIAYENLNLNDNGMAYAPALPYFVDTAYSYDGDLSRYCANAPSGGRVTFVNATGSERNYHFTGGANGKSGYFTLKDGHAVDLLVFNTQSSTQVSLVPIGIDFSTGV